MGLQRGVKLKKKTVLCCEWNGVADPSARRVSRTDILQIPKYTSSLGDTLCNRGYIFGTKYFLTFKIMVPMYSQKNTEGLWKPKFAFSDLRAKCLGQ